MRKRLFFFVCLVVCLVMGWLVVGGRKVSAVDVGEPAPDFTLTDALSGSTVSLADQIGKVVLLDFFETSCPVCRQAFDNDLVPLYNQTYEDDPYVVFLSIDIWEEGITAEQLQSFALAHGVTWPILMGSSSGVNQAYEVTWIPTLFLIDGDGVIRLRYNGGSPGTEILREEIDLLRGPLAVDTNCDGIVNIFDLYAVGGAFGSTPIDSHWNASADIDNDDIVNEADLTLVSNDFGNAL